MRNRGRPLEQYNAVYQRCYPKDNYEKLRAFAIILTTQDERQFKAAYTYATGYEASNRKVGYHIWNIIQGKYDDAIKRYQKKYRERNLQK